MDDDVEGEDPVEELAAEVAAAAEAAELKEYADGIEREHRAQEARRLEELRSRRVDELYEWLLQTLGHIQREGPLSFTQSSSTEPGSQPINVRWDRLPQRHIVLDFNRYRGTIRVWQLTNIAGEHLAGGQVSREIDAASDEAEHEIEAALRWLWHRTPDPHP